MSNYLSIVVTARNDDHGGNLLERMQLFVTALIEQCKKYNLDAELIIVEWNPPSDKPRLKDALEWQGDFSPCAVRIIEVPESIHSRFKYSDKLPLFQMIAKNVGTRRAKGDFVLATNIDIIFSDELISFLASRKLRRGRMYRIDRHDIPQDVPAGTSLDELLKYCRENVIRIHRREGSLTHATGHYHEVLPPIRRRWSVVEKLRDLGLGTPEMRSRLHTNACGDFTLMSRKDWFRLRGYPEIEIFSFHLDSLFCHAAHHGGARELVLEEPMRIYHIEHGAGSGWTPEAEAKLKKRLQEAGIEELNHDRFEALALQMRKKRKPVICGDEDWGLARESLTEFLIESS
ncbi:MAG: hypothetical protein ACYS8W_13245 [Planctomycetota bacterium]|jgi:hypothetical protein